MNATTTTQAPKKGNGAIPGARPMFAPLTLESLGLMSVPALAQQYSRGSVPGTLAALDGTARGRLLRLFGWAGQDPLATLIRHLANSRFFPWRGKRFQSRSSGHGRGVNRIRFLGLREIAPFKTRMEPSLLDGRPCICFDYDVPGNPRLLQRIHDEIREVSPGLFMGPALLRIGDLVRPLFYFALEITP